MSLVPFESLPDSSRVWIFAADRTLSREETRQLLVTLDDYLETWKAHGAPVQASRELKYDQFLIIAANPDVTAPSGCSIDHMTRAIKDLGQKFDVDFFGTANVYFRQKENIRVVDRPSFKRLAREGEVNEDTVVFNNALTTLEDIRSERWEVPAKQSWHKSYVSSVSA